MGGRILIRNDLNRSPFNKALNSLVQLEGEELILCSGYFSKHILEYNKCELLNNIEKGFQWNEGLLILIGGKISSTACTHGNYKYDKCEACKLQEFYDVLARLHNFNIKVKGYRNDSYHSKIAIKVRDKNPIAMIIGSSNLSGNAYLLDKHKNKSSYKPNFECDVLIWNDKGQKIYDINSYNVTESYGLNILENDLLKNKFDTMDEISCDKVDSDFLEHEDRIMRYWYHKIKGIINNDSTRELG